MILMNLLIPSLRHQINEPQDVNMLQALYTIIISPLVQIFEVFFVLLLKIFKSPGVCLLGVSFFVTILSLPLYIIAERWQQKERNKIAELKPKIDKIKGSFKGDEQYMILSVLYRQNHYHPVYALRNSFSILIQIPFFIAAYNYISGLDILKGASFWLVRDLYYPDALLSFRGFGINILPLLMTLINVVSGVVYTHKLAPKDKIQIYLVALVSLILLYNSPSGLVLYWIMNQVFSLLKNIFYYLKNPLKILYFSMAALLLCFIIYIIFINNGSIDKRILLIGAAILLLLAPLFLKFTQYLYKTHLMFLTLNKGKRNLFFILICLVLTIISGLTIISMVISSAPEEFSFIDNSNSPFDFISHSLLINIGFFLFWPACIYFLFGERIKTLLAFFYGLFFINAIINTFIFPGDYVAISNTFTFDTTASLNASIIENIINIVSLCMGFVLLTFLFKKKLLSVINSMVIITLVSLMVFSGYNIYNIQKGYLKITELRGNSSAIETILPILNFSQKEPNVVIFMSDCAIGAYVSPIFKEKPELLKSFDGFVHYPNVVSYSQHTLTGLPPIYGGFDYTPVEMNKKRETPLKIKHNEALLTMPLLFINSGYEVIVTDPSLANYENIPDLSIYNGYDHIKAANTIGHYNQLWYKQHNIDGNIISKKIKRNSLFFSFLKISPPVFRFLLYDKSKYWGINYNGDLSETFMNSYAVMDFLPELTEYNSIKPSALFIGNETTHSNTFLQYPDYNPVEKISNRGSGFFQQSSHYHANMAFYLKFAEWLEDLKNNGVYDNTRIIIVSDHGASVDAKMAEENINIQGERREGYNPVLLVKDFNARGLLPADFQFMTTADVPTLALKGIVENPVNPATGKEIPVNYKENGVFITTNHKPNVADHNKNTFRISDNQWIHVENNIFNANNWRQEKP